MNFRTPLFIATAAVVLTGYSVVPAAANECSSVVKRTHCEEFGRLGARVSEKSELNEAERRGAKGSVTVTDDMESSKAEKKANKAAARAEKARDRADKKAAKAAQAKQKADKAAAAAKDARKAAKKAARTAKKEPSKRNAAVAAKAAAKAEKAQEKANVKKSKAKEKAQQAKKADKKADKKEAKAERQAEHVNEGDRGAAPDVESLDHDER